MSSFIANSDIKRVSGGMMRVVDILDDYKHAEKKTIISALFNSLYNSKLKDTYSVSDIMEIIDNIRWEAQRTKVPEFGGAERYIQGEM